MKAQEVIEGVNLSHPSRRDEVLEAGLQPSLPHKPCPGGPAQKATWEWFLPLLGRPELESVYQGFMISRIISRVLSVFEDTPSAQTPES